MTVDTVVDVRHISKVYKLYDQNLDRIKETFHPFQKKYHRDFHALRDVSFSVSKGEILGIVGRNGCGKSTILQIITGVLTPTSGTVEVKGKVSALLELGAGFNPELTGLENVYFKSSLLGCSEDETNARMDDILEFADIGEFVRQPVKTYSSGMFVRLAFAVAINVDPDILIVDEALSVGDYRFRQKCMRRFNSFLNANKTILFVTHDYGAVEQFCTRAIWLKDGAVCQDGNPTDVCKDYVSFMSYGETANKEIRVNADPIVDHSKSVSSPGGTTDNKRLEWQDTDGCSSFGQGGAIISKVAFYSKSDGKRIDVFEGGKRVVFCVEIVCKTKIDSPIVGFHLSNAKGVHLLGLNNAAAGIMLGPMLDGDVKNVEFEFDFPYLRDGRYSFSPAIADGTPAEHVQHHWVHDAYVLMIASHDELAQIGNQFVIKENFAIRLS